jgi:hypothetical protein
LGAPLARALVGLLITANVIVRVGLDLVRLWHRAVERVDRREHAA